MFSKFDGSSQWPVEAWITRLAEGGGPKKRFHCCSNPNSSKHFLYFRAIQGHSRGNLVDPALQGNVLLPEDFTEYIHHVGSLSEICSTIRSGLIPGGRSLKRDRQSVFFTAVNPMDDDQSMEENSMRLGQAKDRTFKARTEERIAILSNTITRNRSPQHTTCYLCGENGMHETKVELYQSPRLPRVILKPNSRSGQQDQPDQEARKSSDHQSASGRFGETRSGNVDFRIPGIPHSTVQQQDTNRKDTVKQLIRQFENHPNKESFLQGFSGTESKKLITDMGNTEIFELCETSYKKQCPDCNLHREIGIVYRSCVRCLTPSQSTKKLDKKNCDVLSIPGYVKKTSTAVPNMELPSGNDCTTKPRRCCKKHANPSMVGTKQFWKQR